MLTTLKKTILLLLLPALFFPLSYGKNKINYKQLEWKELLTGNFELYFTLKDENLAKEFAICSEESYARLTEDLKVFPSVPVKIFIYASNIDFEQTNITADLIDEGVGGFTEPLKDRVVLPAVTSPKRMKEVLTHEMTHALQFESLYGGFGKSYQLAKALFIPIWVMEGMAEYEAEDYDSSITDMLLRDGVLNNRIKGIEYLGSFNYIEGRDVVLMYKEAQYIFDYIAKTYGKDKVGLILKEFGYLANTQDLIIKKVLGLEINDFDKKWQYDLKEKYFAQAKGRKEARDYAVKLTGADGLRPAYNTKPVFSAGGDKIYFLCDALNYTGLMALDVKTGTATELIGRWYDSFAQAGNALSVSPDGQYLAFASKAGGTQKIRILDLKENRIVFEGDFGLELVYSPVFNAENEFLFIGVKEGKSDIYVGNMKGRIVKRLTEDRYDETEAVFSEDGLDVYFSSERENGFRNLYKITNWRAGSGAELILGGRVNYTGLTLTKEKNIILSADTNGIYNLCFYEQRTKALSALTDVRGGAFSPKLAPGGRKLVFSYFEESSYNLYLLDYEQELKLVRFEGPAAEVKLPEKKDYKLTNLPVVPYRPGFSPDLIYFLAGYDTESGLMGGAYVSGSDLLGENNIEIFAAAINEVQTGAQFNYRNNAWRINFGVSVYTWRTYGASLLAGGTIAGHYYTEETGLALPVIYPFDRYNRLELGFNTYIKDNYYYQGTGANYRNITNSVSFSFVNDCLSYNIDEPCAGGAFNFSVERAAYFLGSNQSFLNLLAETKQFIFIDRETIIGARLFAGASTGADPGSFDLGAGVLRGYFNGEYNGSKLLLANLELRFPLVEKAELNVWPAGWLLIKKIKFGIFSDQAVVFNNYLLLRSGDLKNGVGFGLRIHGFIWQTLPVLLRLDAGFRTDGGATPVYNIALGHIF